MSQGNMMKFIPVEASKWGEMVQATARVKELESENASLKAEVERLKEFYDLSVTPSRELQAQVERLTKAGDAMHCFLIGYIVENRLSSAHLNKLDDDWANAAKGVQS